MPPTCQHSEPADTPPSTTPARHASRKTSSSPCTRQTASRLATLPPPTQITSWASRWPGVRHRGHGEQAEVADPDGAARERAVQPGHPRRVVAGGGAQVAQTRPVGRAGELEREVEHRSGRPVVGAAAAGGEADAGGQHRWVRSRASAALLGRWGGAAGRSVRRTARAARAPLAIAPWIDGVSRWSPQTNSPPPRSTGAAQIERGECGRLRPGRPSRVVRCSELRVGHPVRPCDLLPDLRPRGSGRQGRARDQGSAVGGVAPAGRRRPPRC